MEKMTYKTEKGEVLYGYSQTSLDKNTKTMKLLAAAIFGGAILFFGYLVWLTTYVIHNNIINNIVARCVN